MSNSDDSPDSLNLSDRATLSLLSTLEDDQHVSQRSLASRLGVALGMANGLMRRSIRKGLVKVQQAPAKRYVYYVTPKGFTEKSRLVADYLSASLSFFRRAREEYALVLDQAVDAGHKRIALYGDGELAEIALLSAQGNGHKLTAMIALGSNRSEICTLPVISNLETLESENIDAVVITCHEQPQKAYDLMVEQLGQERVYVAPLLHVRLQQDCGGQS